MYDSIDMLLTNCYVRTDIFTTKLGLRIGDSVEKSVELYGGDYTEFFNGYVYIRKYDMGEYHFRVDIREDTVSSWGIVKNS